MYRRFKLEQGLRAAREAAAGRPAVDRHRHVWKRGQALEQHEVKSADALAVQAKAYPHIGRSTVRRMSLPTQPARFKNCPIYVRLLPRDLNTPVSF
ncbi:hypothetical protein [Mesorhizobium sp. Mes31]|uniref:hypothetical protein n=1 Tax=Mesorhizobium sp. Mes31 TaxID=2926017 RepID=UPI002119A1D1|nr:hypothetical protein [Mesorhizobium sp. Mes31]